MSTPTMTVSAAVAISKRDINMGLGRRTASAFNAGTARYPSFFTFVKRGGSLESLKSKKKERQTRKKKTRMKRSWSWRRGGETKAHGPDLELTAKRSVSSVLLSSIRPRRGIPDLGVVPSA